MCQPEIINSLPTGEHKQPEKQTELRANWAPHHQNSLRGRRLFSPGNSGAGSNTPKSRDNHKRKFYLLVPLANMNKEKYRVSSTSSKQTISSDLTLTKDNCRAGKQKRPESLHLKLVIWQLTPQGAGRKGGQVSCWAITLYC